VSAGRAVTTITAPRVVTGTAAGVLEPGYVRVTGGVIAAAGAGPPAGVPDIALPAGTLAPGLVDLQVNGYYGVDLSAADPAGWRVVASRLPETGVTAFLPTFITAPLPVLAHSLRAAAELIPGLRGGARALGVHLEGPFLSPARRGAHPQEWITAPDAAAVASLIAAGRGVLRLVTLAPECDGGLDAVTQFREAGVVVSAGHSDATAAQLSAAAGRGARMVTHLFNGQRPLHHREPGVAGQALADPRLTSGLIADLRHVHPLLCAIAFAAAPGRICLVTDAAPCAGLPPGRYAFGGGPVILPPGAGEPPVREDGTLAGSSLALDVAVANVTAAGVPLAAAITAATRIPADLIGRADLGRIAPGAAADLVWLGDDLRARATWVAGRQVHPRAAPGD
jgi:N-acetylglucosamine-6-phosphate deacetylase